MEEQAVARRDTTPLMQRDPKGLANHFAKSGYFKDARSESQAVVKIVAGEELGIGPMAAMQGIHFIDGKLAMGANLQAVQVKRSESYDYRIEASTDKLCTLTWTCDGQDIGTSEFTIEQAEQAGLIKPKSGWATYPEDMLFARALTRGIRRFCPEVMAGTPAYTPEELGAEVDQSGEPVYVESEATAEPTLETLDSESVQQLANAISEVEPQLDAMGVNWLDGLNVLLGSIGIDAFSPSARVVDELERLTPEQGDTLNAELHKLATEGAEQEGADGS